MKQGLIATLLVAAVAAGCGGKNTHTTKQPAATSTGTTRTTAAGSSVKDCNALGINPTGMREGTCTHAGITWVIVDENHTLKLKTLWASLSGVRTTKALSSTTASTTANGEFVIATVKITNKLPAAQGFDQAGSQQAALNIEGVVTQEDGGVESQADANSCLKLGTSLQSNQSVTCDVIFDVPTRAAADLGKHGGGDLYLVNFGSDLAGSVLPQTIGQVRLYR